MRRAYAFGTIVLLVTSQSYADILYSNSVINYLYHRSDLDPAYLELADDFVLQPCMNLITGIQWWGLELGDHDNSFTIRIFVDSDARPALTPTVEFNHLVPDQFGTPWNPIRFEVAIAPLWLEPDRPYWISIVNEENGSMWAWSSARFTNNIFIRTDDGGEWQARSWDTGMAFALTGPVVPEPASLGILTLGLGLAAARITHRTTRAKTQRRNTA